VSKKQFKHMMRRISLSKSLRNDRKNVFRYIQLVKKSKAKNFYEGIPYFPGIISIMEMFLVYKRPTKVLGDLYWIFQKNEFISLLRKVDPRDNDDRRFSRPVVVSSAVLRSSYGFWAPVTYEQWEEQRQRYLESGYDGLNHFLA